MKALLFVLIWSSARPLMSSYTQLMPDLAACNKAAAAIQATVSNSAPLGGQVVTNCTAFDPPAQ